MYVRVGFGSIEVGRKAGSRHAPEPCDHVDIWKEWPLL